jgi:capsular exopolysaccharide synthesis family protein
LSRIQLSNTVDSSVIRVTDQQITFYEAKLKFYLNKKLDNNILLSNVDGSIAKYWVALNARKIDLMNRNQVLPKRISELEDKIARYSNELETVPFLELEYEKLSRRKGRYEQALTSFYNKLIETELAEASEGGYVDILDNAVPRPYPINKQTTTGIFQGVFFGIGFAILIILGFDRIDTRIKTNEDIESEGVNLVAGIPSMNEIISKEFNGKNFVEFGGTNLSTKLLSVLKPLSGISELYRRLRSNFLFSLPDLKNKSIVITSANPQEGKSVTASNLAIVLAQSGKSVLLVDADLRRPNLDVLFGVRNSPGLSDLVINDLESHEVIYPTVADNLHIIPAGNPVPNPAEIIGSSSFKRVHAKLTSEFDFVIYDSPPVNSVVDAVSIAEHVDLGLVIVKAGKTKRKELKNAFNILHFVEDKFMGVLLNNINSKNFITDYNYYSNYNYYGNRTLKDEELV